MRVSTFDTTDIASAFGRIEAFLAVQDGARGDELVAEVDHLQAAAGIGPDQRSAISYGLARLESLDPRAGDVMLGVIVGLLAATEHPTEAVH